MMCAGVHVCLGRKSSSRPAAPSSMVGPARSGCWTRSRVLLARYCAPQKDGDGVAGAMSSVVGAVAASARCHPELLSLLPDLHDARTDAVIPIPHMPVSGGQGGRGAR